MSILEFILRLGAALLMGAVVGLERQWRQRMAGARTSALVAAGARLPADVRTAGIADPRVGILYAA